MYVTAVVVPCCADMIPTCLIRTFPLLDLILRLLKTGGFPQEHIGFFNEGLAPAAVEELLSCAQFPGNLCKRV
jgi:hypothetical protein